MRQGVLRGFLTVAIRRTLSLIPLVVAAYASLAHTGRHNIVGYANLWFEPGDNLAANPLEAYPTNLLSQLMIAPPDGTSVSLWNPATRSFDQTSLYTVNWGWSLEFTLDPGQAFKVHAPTNFFQTFVGTMLAPDGSWLIDEEEQPHPPVFSGPTGVYLLASKSPWELGSPRWPVFEWVLGRGPVVGEQFTWLVASNQTYYTTTYTGTSWDNGEPRLPMGEAAFFNLIGVPVLGLARSGDQLVVSWPAWATNFTVEASTSLGPSATWGPVTNALPMGPTSIAVTMGPTPAFFRLHSE